MAAKGRRRSSARLHAYLYTASVALAAGLVAGPGAAQEAPPTPAAAPATQPDQQPPPLRGQQPAKQDPTRQPAPANAPPPTGAPVVPAPGRAAENAVREAQDAFGFSVGRETLGIYSAGNVRGFSPAAAGNFRIEGLFYDSFLAPTSRLRRSLAIRVGLSATGYPFPSPTGIVDFALRKPDDKPGVSMLAAGDSFGSYSFEFDASLPVTSTLSLGFGAQGALNEFQNGTGSKNNNQGVLLRWRPTPDVEVIPFWQRLEVQHDEQGPIYIPNGAFLPPRIPRRRYFGPGWTNYNTVGSGQGLLVTASPFADWTVRAGLFRSLYDDRSNFAHLFSGLTQDGRANRIIIADPRSRFVSVSGEVRVSRALTEGPRLHVLSLSYRGRDRRQRYAGSDVIDYGPTFIGERFRRPEPRFDFTEQTRDEVKQSLYGLSYEGRWRDVGELSFGVSRTEYSKRFDLPGAPTLVTRSNPWLYNVTGAGFLGPRLSIYAGYARGLEESGIAPNNATNRNQPLPAIVTSQVDAGFRYRLTDKVRLSAGVFDLRKPYYNLDAANRFDLLGDVVSRGVELSVAGAITPRLSTVVGGVLLRPRVTGDGVRLGRIGPRPVGLAPRSVDLNLDWRLPWVEGLSLDTGISSVSDVPATRDNRVSIPGRTLVDLGGRYRFKLGQRDATLRVQLSNVGNVYGYDLRGAGAYDPIQQRQASGYLTIDF